MLVMARIDEYIQQLVTSEAIIAAASKKKDVTAIVRVWTNSKLVSRAPITTYK